MELANFMPPTDLEWELMRSLIPAYVVPDEFEEEDHYLQRCDEEDRVERQLWETQQYQSLLVNESRGQALAGRRTLETLFHTMGRNSLLVEFSFQATRRDILVTPYHAHALHSVEDHEAILTARPAVIAHKTGALLSTELQELERILGDAATRERDIQMYLERHPSIFTALGYAHVYPQIVLTREDGTALRPDFFVERADRGWADILDLKVPSMQTVVGGRDRKTLAAAIHELAAQLREYAAYFEDERLSKRIEELYGIRCYKPRLIGIVGHDPRLDDQRQLRRLMTAYSDLSVLTFDQLLQIAKSRLLI
jgi:hypothetical protein